MAGGNFGPAEKRSSSVEIPPAKVATVCVVRREVNVYTVHCIFTPQVVRTPSKVQYLYSFWERCTCPCCLDFFCDICR
jgi:hypothetical protein